MKWKQCKKEINPRFKQCSQLPDVNPELFKWKPVVRNLKPAIDKHHSLSLDRHRNLMFDLEKMSVSTCVYGISHTYLKAIFICVINGAQQSELQGEQHISVLIRQQVISTQTACVLKQQRSMKSQTCAHTQIKTQWQHFKWYRHDSLMFNQTCKHA